MEIVLVTECPYCSAVQESTVEMEGNYVARTRRTVVVCHYPVGCQRAYVIEYYVPPIEITVLKIEGYEDMEMPAMA